MKIHTCIYQTLLGLIFICFSNVSFSMCSFSNISIFPNNNKISTNSIFIIEGYASSQNLIKHLNKTNAIYLISEKDTIPLIVIKTLEGQFQLTQAILKPSSNLIAGRQYKLNIDSLDEYEKTDFERNSIHWTVSNINDNQNPIWNKTPRYISKEMVYYGCGPAVLVNFCACIADLSPVVIYTKVRNLKNDSINDYYITPESNSFQLGHGMCSGEFVFDDGQEYEAIFSLMDASGNVSEETEPLKFTSPTQQDYSQYDEKQVICSCSKNSSKEQTKIFWIIIPFVVVGLIVLVLNDKSIFTNN